MIKKFDIRVSEPAIFENLWNGHIIGLRWKKYMRFQRQFRLSKNWILQKEKYGLNVCGEGGEYETFTLDCPLYIKSIVMWVAENEIIGLNFRTDWYLSFFCSDECETVIVSDDNVVPVGHINFKKMHLQPKNVSGALSVVYSYVWEIFLSTLKCFCRTELNYWRYKKDCKVCASKLHTTTFQK